MAKVEIKTKNKASKMDNLTKSEKLMQGIGLWTSFYRLFPHLFCKDHLGIMLKPFQIVLIYVMNISQHFIYIASRGQGKTFLTAIFCCVRCILYPRYKDYYISGCQVAVY